MNYLGVDMWKDRRNLALLAGLLGLLMSDPIRSLEPKAPDDGLSRKEFFAPELYISSSNEPLEGVLGSLPNRHAWESFLAVHGQGENAPVHAFIDPRSGAATNLVGAFPLIPGPGIGNRVTRDELAARLGRPVETVDAAAVGDAVLAFVRGHADVLGVDPAQLGAARSVQVNPQLWQIAIPQTYKGLPVRHGRLAASISHGNLVVIGTETWGDVRRLSPAPGVSAEAAVAAGFDHAGGRSSRDEILREPGLEILPAAPPEYQQGEGFAGPVGAGYRHRLVWTFVFQRPPEHALWEVIVDAQNGEVLAFQDINQYANRSVTGGVYPLTSTEICPNAATCGTMQSGWPMPFANTGLAVPNDFANSAGIFDYLGGTATTKLAGRYVKIADQCGPASKGSPGGWINLSGVNGQHDCTSGGGSAGNTASARSAYYEVNKIAEQARGWLPFNAWLQGQLLTNVNISSTCNAFYDFFSINFFRSGGGCRNTGEIAGVFDHEWGHGLDDNDAGGALSNSSEAYADIAAIYRLQTSCVGHGFFKTFDSGCGQTSDGTGFNANEAQTGPSHCDLDCSGVRDADWDKHSDHTPDTALGFVCTSCFGGSGPCGRQVHCAAAPSRQAAWDLVARDLQAPPFSYDSQTAFLVGNKLFYHGSGNVGLWHACTCGSSSSGCGSTNAYMQWLTADDDNGNLSDGTPHMTAIYDAFDRHGIACATPAPQNSGCAAGPSGQPALTGTPNNFSADLSWSSVTGATKYWVFRTEGHAGCDFGKTKIAETTALSFTDAQVAAGRSYYYNVVAAESSACYGAASNCVTVAVQGVDTSCYALTLTHTGDGADPVALPDHSDGCPTGQYHPAELIQLTASPDPNRVAATWSGTDNDNVLLANLNTVTMPSSSHAASVHYGQAIAVTSIDFESDPGLSVTGLWHRTAACAAATSGHSLPMALYYGIDAQCDYDNGFTNSGTATLPPISLANIEPPILLNFNYFLDTEGLSPYDAAAALISVNGGPFQTVARNHPLAGAITLADPSSGWTPASVDVSNHADSTVEIRFSFNTVDSVLNSFPGFYVDDVQIARICTDPSNLNLTNQTITTTQLFEACETITASTNFVVGSTGDVTFHAGQKVVMGPGFKVLAGGRLEVRVP
jgi:trimeric autotransporter adhesin